MTWANLKINNVPHTTSQAEMKCITLGTTHLRFATWVSLIHVGNKKGGELSTTSSSNEKRSRMVDLAVPLAVGLIGILGSLGGVYLGNIMSLTQTERVKAIEWESQILAQRIALLDRAAKIFGKAPGIQDVWDKYTAGLGKSEPKLEVVEKLTEYQGEYQSVVYLSVIYFGPKTRAALKELSDEKVPWWNKQKSKQDALLGAMSEELTLGVNRLPKILQAP